MPVEPHLYKGRPGNGIFKIHCFQICPIYEVIPSVFLALRHCIGLIRVRNTCNFEENGKLKEMLDPL